MAAADTSSGVLIVSQERLQYVQGLVRLADGLLNEIEMLVRAGVPIEPGGLTFRDGQIVRTGREEVQKREEKEGELNQIATMLARMLDDSDVRWLRVQEGYRPEIEERVMKERDHLAKVCMAKYKHRVAALRKEAMLTANYTTALAFRNRLLCAFYLGGLSLAATFARAGLRRLAADMADHATWRISLIFPKEIWS
jgi:hypothetical protein